MGLFDILNPLFTGIETYCLSWIPAWARVALYGLGSGIATMLLYAKFSNQDALTQGKQASKKALSRLRELDPEAEFDVVLATMRKAIAEPLKQAKTAAIPALWASLPLVFVLVWLGNSYSYQAPSAGSTIQALTEPFVRLQEGNGVHRSEGQTYSLTWPESGQIELKELTGDLIISIPSSTHVPLIHKRKWWNMFVGNPAGYIRESAPITSVEFTIPPKELIDFGPHWLRSWLVFYFAVLMAAAVAIKVKFNIA
jgi:hypothetical protein